MVRWATFIFRQIRSDVDLTQTAVVWPENKHRVEHESTPSDQSDIISDVMRYATHVLYTQVSTWSTLHNQC